MAFEGATKGRHRAAACLIAAALLLPLRVAPVAPGLEQARPATRPVPGLPVVGEFRYNMAAKIRPLLLFWIGRDHVGGASVVLRRDEAGGRDFELLIGSDPGRAPTGINRWGYIREQVRDRAAQTLGVMKQSDEQSVDEAKSRLKNEATRGFFFKTIRATVEGADAASTVTLTRVPRDFTYRELTALLEQLKTGGQQTSMRHIAVPPGTRLGFLTALSELVQQDVEAYRLAGRRILSHGSTTIPYVYNARLYDAVLVSSRLIDQWRIGARVYRRAIEADFTTGWQGSRDVDRFSLVYAADGPLAGLPVLITYQPRWWLKVELTLDETGARQPATSW